MTPAIVAFCGLATCGKTSLALGLVKHRNFHRISFADPIREMLRGLGLTTAHMSEGKNEPLAMFGGKTPRQVMQSLGTEWGRDLVCPNIWLNATKTRILSALAVPGVSGVVLDDCRFDNEASMVKDLGGMVIEVVRPGLVRMDHASEAGISDHLVDDFVLNEFISLEYLTDWAPSLLD
jgi:hypothetical protein